MSPVQEYLLLNKRLHAIPCRAKYFIWGKHPAGITSSVNLALSSYQRDHLELPVIDKDSASSKRLDTKEMFLSRLRSRWEKQRNGTAHINMSNTTQTVSTKLNWGKTRTCYALHNSCELTFNTDRIPLAIDISFLRESRIFLRKEHHMFWILLCMNTIQIV